MIAYVRLGRTDRREQAYVEADVSQEGYTTKYDAVESYTHRRWQVIHRELSSRTRETTQTGAWM